MSTPPPMAATAARPYGACFGLAIAIFFTVGWRNACIPFARVGFACESLKVTTRIMHIVAWLLTQRAIESGEIPERQGRRPERRLGNANDSDPVVVALLPETARRLIVSSADLYSRVKRLDEGTMFEEPAQSPARALMGQLERGLGGHTLN